MIAVAHEGNEKVAREAQLREGKGALIVSWTIGETERISIHERASHRNIRVEQTANQAI